jgi:cytochrome c oxidase assembly protein subunit 11
MAQAAYKSNRRVAALAAGLAAAMLGLAFASVPLYRLFCQATGFGGTTQRAEAPPDKALAKTISVRFDANISGGLSWSFHPVATAVKVKLGEQNIAHYRAVNTSSKTLTGTAAFNVTPETAGIYFNKIECFCFTEQTLKPGEAIDMPVVFFVDPDLAADPDAANISEITLSYTMYPVDKPKTVSGTPAAPGTITN